VNRENLVSVIMPCYNAEDFILEAIDSVKFQTYTNWELIIVDDCSTDGSLDIINNNCKLDSRIRCFRTEVASGSPTLPRNLGIAKARGRFIAFLDSDDLWDDNKLSDQIELFNDWKVAIVFSNYEKIDEEGFMDNRIINAPLCCDYKKLLRGNIIACCTCIFDTNKVGKKYFPLQGHEDYALWLLILREGYIAKNTGSVLAKYRVRSSSVSSNKIKAIFWVYRIFRNNENFTIVKSLFYTVLHSVKSFIKYLI
jgi:glycosyltransferase involved in cell wall biosynthesis